MAIKQCPSCHGTGKMKILSRFKDEENDVDLTLEGTINCPKCYGTGMLAIVEDTDLNLNGARAKQIPIIQIA